MRYKIFVAYLRTAINYGLKLNFGNIQKSMCYNLRNLILDLMLKILSI